MEQTGNERVVFVDDERRVCEAVRKTLERVGVQTLCFDAARDCLDHLAGERCDLLITDVKMPGMDGIELLTEVRQLLPWIPIIVVTGYGDVPTAVRALKAGAVDFIEKPLDRETFLDRVQAALTQNTAHSALMELSLTRIQMKVLRLLLEGKNNREIAALLHRSHRTIEVHRSHLMQKMGAGNVIELLRRAIDLGLIEDIRQNQTGVN